MMEIIATAFIIYAIVVLHSHSDSDCQNIKPISRWRLNCFSCLIYNIQASFCRFFFDGHFVQQNAQNILQMLLRITPISSMDIQLAFGVFISIGNRSIGQQLPPRDRR